MRERDKRKLLIRHYQYVPLNLIVTPNDNVPRFLKSSMFPHDAAAWAGLGITGTKDPNRSQMADDRSQSIVFAKLSMFICIAIVFQLAVTRANTKMK